MQGTRCPLRPSRVRLIGKGWIWGWDSQTLLSLLDSWEECVVSSVKKAPPASPAGHPIVKGVGSEAGTHGLEIKSSLLGSSSAHPVLCVLTAPAQASFPSPGPALRAPSAKHSRHSLVQASLLPQPRGKVGSRHLQRKTEALGSD